MEELKVTEQLAITAYNDNALDKVLQLIKKDALGFVGDPETPLGRKQIISKAAAVASAKVIIDNAGKQLNEERKKLTDIVNEERKKARDFLDNLKVEVRKPVTDWEKVVEEKIEAERLAVEMEMAQEEAIAVNELFDRQRDVERREAELKAKEDARIAKEKAEQEEKERAEREARIAKEAKEQAEREAHDAIEAEKRAKIEAELKAKADAERAGREKVEAAERAEREKKEAVEKAKREEQERQAEAKRQEEEKARKAKEVADRKAANVAHQRKVNREAVESFVENGITEEIAKKIITMIAHDKIKNITIGY